jgi:ABC-type polar amino acid transport system ATPase subunit
MLELKRLKKNHKQLTVLNDVSLTLNAGDLAILLGHSGVGKSTVLRILNGLDTIDSGQIFLEGMPLHQIPPTRHPIGMVFQEYNLFSHLNAELNITLPLTSILGYSKEKAHAISKQLLNSYNLSEKAALYPNQLSGGQKQRLAIARAVAMEPIILCMDEPTSALDPKQTRKVVQHIVNLSKEGKIIVIATHDTAILSQLDCTIHLMEKGKLAETASSRNFFNKRNNFPKINSYLTGER